MSVLHRDPHPPAAPGAASTEPAASNQREVSRTRTSVAWLGVCTAAAILVVLVVFILQNQGSVEVSFLWMQGSLPLAMALLIAGAGAALLTTMAGMVRITQLRRRSRLGR